MFEEEHFECYEVERECRVLTREELRGEISYELIEKSEEVNEGETFEKVVGHEEQKKELLTILNWFKHSKELRERGLSIPRGVLLFGEPGNGKSLMIKSLMKSSEAPVLVFKGNNENIVGGIIETFNKAKELGHSVIVIDELDLLIDRDSRVIRALQECLDGVESNDDILVLTATNGLNGIPCPIVRSGRLEKIIEIPFPTNKEAVVLFKKYFNDFNVQMPSGIDEEELGLMLNHISCVDIKSIVNDIILRNGFEGITSDAIDESIYRITKYFKDSPKEENLQVAIHEAGHALVAKAYPEFFKVNRLNISGASGVFSLKEIEEGFCNYKKAIAHIKICMGGLLAEKIVCGIGSRGCSSDLDLARKMAYGLFNRTGYSSCWETLPPPDDESRKETSIKKRRMERKIERLLRKCERQTKRYIKKHKKEIYSLGKLLYEKKNLKSGEILSCIENAK